MTATYDFACNQTVFLHRPPDKCINNDMKLTQTSLITISVYLILFILSSVFNVTIIVFLYKYKLKELSRIHWFMFHLIIADLMITFVTIPMEIGWKFTVYWGAGEIGCKMFQFLRPVGIYLASFIIISLCIDRYFAIIYPLKIRNSNRRTNILIYSSWGLAVVCSLPQIFLFSLKTHPQHKWYKQCLDITFDASFSSSTFYKFAFLFYQIFVSCITFFLPLAVIVVTYSRILCKIIREPDFRNYTPANGCTAASSNTRSSASFLFSQNRSATIKKAKKKTLKLAIKIVLVFLVCWTPYYFISVMFWIDPSIAQRIDDRIYNFLFIFAVSNCLANPLVYGLTTISLAKKIKLRREKNRSIYN